MIFVHLFLFLSIFIIPSLLILLTLSFSSSGVTPTYLLFCAAPTPYPFAQIPSLSALISRREEIGDKDGKWRLEKMENTKRMRVDVDNSLWESCLLFFFSSYQVVHLSVIFWMFRVFFYLL